MKTTALTAALAAIPAGRSAWSRAVHAYAVELVEALDDSTDLSNETLLRKDLLNGADDPAEWDWEDYNQRAERGSVSSTLYLHGGKLFWSCAQ